MSSLFTAPFNVLSLFDGMSCGQIALNRIGKRYDRYYASEIDKHAIRVTQHNYPDTVQLGDVTSVTADRLSPISLLMGGSPCQGFSSAGKGLNFDDPRSKLFFEFVRLKNELKPRWFLLENVNMKKEWRDIISGHMGVEPVMINSADFSAQNRVRWYWTNIPIAEWEACRITLTDILELGWVSDRTKSYCIDANYGKGANFKRYFHRGSRQIVFRDGHIPLSRPSEEEANNVQRVNRDTWRMLTPVECERLQTIPDGYTSAVSRNERYKMLGNGWTVDVIAHILRGIDTASRSV